MLGKTGGQLAEAQPHQGPCVADVGQIGVQRERLVVAGGRGVVAAGNVQRGAQQAMDLRVGGRKRNGALETFDGRGQLVHVAQDDAERLVSGRVLWIGGDGTFEQRGRLAQASLRRHGAPQDRQRADVSGADVAGPA